MLNELVDVSCKSNLINFLIGRKEIEGPEEDKDNNNLY